MSVLRQYTDDRSVRIHKLSDSGLEQSALLTQLPQWEDIEGAYITLLNPSEKGDWLRMVLNKAPQKTYSLEDPADTHLPALIQRKRHTIPVTTYQHGPLSSLMNLRQLPPPTFDVYRQPGSPLTQVRHQFAGLDFQPVNRGKPFKESFNVFHENPPSSSERDSFHMAGLTSGRDQGDY